MDSIRIEYPEVASIKSKFKFYDSETKKLSSTTEERELKLELAYGFQVSCICWECVNGGYDLNSILYRSIKDRASDVTGSLICNGWQDKQRRNKHRCNTRLEYFYTIVYNDWMTMKGIFQ